MQMLTHRGRLLIAWIVIFTFLDLLTTLLRFYAIKVQRRSLRVDDYLIIVAVASMLALDGCAAWAIHNGLGGHADQLSWDQTVVQIKLVVSSFWSWTVATVCCKLAILFLYLNIFHVNYMRKWFYLLITLTAAYAFAFIPYFMTQCMPVSAAWDPVLMQTNCKPSRNQELASVSINITLDLAIVLLPAPLVWNLHMPVKKKVVVTGVFSLGFCIVGVMLWRLIETAKPPAAVPDFPFDLYVLALQSFLELWLGILAANIPTLGPLFQSIIYPKVKNYWDSGSSDKNQPRTSGMIHTFGSSGPKKPRRDEFGLLSEDTGGSIEMDDSAPRGNQIQMARDFFVTVEPSKAHISTKTTPTPEPV